jgi:sister chromatid cohesion protein PDS5
VILQDIFKLFVTYIIPALFDPTNTYNSEHRHVLNSFAEVKSIALLADLDGNESLMLQLFTNIFDGISAPKSTSSERITKDVENDLVDVMTTLIEEAPGLPSKLIDAIFAQFLRGVASTGKRRRDAAELDDGQSTLLLKEEPPAYQMAKTLCNNSVDKMSRYVTQYFSDVLLEASGLGGAVNGHNEDDSDDEDGPAGPSASDLDQLQKAHLLLRELWRACHPILGTVLSQLDTEIAADNVHLRQLATETLGDMIAGIGAAGPPPLPSMDPAAYPPLKMSDNVSQNTATSVLTTPLAPVSFAQTHAGVYHNFVNRRMDKSSAIRAAWATAVGCILSTSAGGIGLSREDEDLFIEGLGEKLADADEKVRLAAIKAIETFQFRDVITKLAAGGSIHKQGSLLGNLADRCRDKKPTVRVEAMALLASLWGVGTGELLANNPAVVAALGDVPSQIFNSFYVGDQHLNVLVDRVTFECLIPLSYPAMKKAAKATNGNSQPTPQNASQAASDQDAIRAERILLLVRGLDDRAKQAFFVIQGRQPQFATVLEAFLKQCEAYNGGVMDENSERIVAGLNKSIQYITKYLPDEAKTTVDLHKFAKLNDRRNYNLIRWVIGQDNDFKSVHRGIKELVKRLQTSKDPTILDTMLPLLYRSGCIMLNRSHLSTIMSVSKTNKDGLGAVAHDFLSQISQRNPDLFKTQLAELCKDLINEAPTADRANEPGVVDSLKACSSYAQKYPRDINLERKFVQTMMDFALYGQPPKAAKYAVNILLCKKDNKSMVHATDLLQRVMKDWSYGSPHFLNKLMAISQLELLAPKVTADAEDDILDMAVQQILLEVRKEGTDHDPDWVADDDLDEESRAKLIALKILVNRLRSDEGAEETQGKTKAAWKLLRKLVIKEGELCNTKDTPKPTRGRLRLKAAQLMLKLCQQKSYDDLLVADFNQLATVIQAEQVEVRHAFAEKLQKYLATGKLKPRFYTILFLTAFEPVSQYKFRIETWLRSRALSFRRQNLPTMESIMPRLISLLAHHPDYSDDVDDLKDTARYLLFYISNVATEANLGMIAKYAERVKQTNDAIDPQKSDSLRVISDLATAVIRQWQERRNWTFQAFAGKVPLPLGLFSALPSHQVAQEIAERNYLPDGIDEKLDELIRAVEKQKVKAHYWRGVIRGQV